MKRRTKVMAAVVGAAALVAIAVPLSARMRDGGCEKPTRDVLRSLTHVDGAALTIAPAFDTIAPAFDDFNPSVCGGRLETALDATGVIEHYSAQLRTDEWTAKVIEAALQARHRNMCLTVMPDSSNPGGPTAVYVQAGPCAQLEMYDPNAL